MSLAESPAELQMPPRQVKWPESREPGIYFGLDAAEYHADRALSNGGMKKLLTHPLEYWADSWMNPDRVEPEQTVFMETGDAYHARVIEGRAVFLSRFAPKLEAADAPDALRTNEDLKARLRELGEKVGGNKDDLTERLLAVDPEAQIWEELVSDYGRKHAGKTLLPRTLMDAIERRAAMIELHPELKRAFTGGYPEVSIFWRDAESGVPLRARLDYLKTKAVVDLKTLSNPLGKPVARAVAGAVASGRYHMQAVHYMAAVEAARGFARKGRVFGEVDPGWLRAFAAAEEMTWLFVFQFTGPAPIAIGRTLPQTNVFDIGRMQVRAAIADYSAHWQAFGELPWVDHSPIAAFDDSEFPAYLGE